MIIRLIKKQLQRINMGRSEKGSLCETLNRHEIWEWIIKQFEEMNIVNKRKSKSWFVLKS